MDRVYKNIVRTNFHSTISYKELAQLINTLTDEQQKQHVSIVCSDNNEMYPIYRAVLFCEDARLDDGSFVLEI